MQSEAEIRIWVADGVANGLRPWFTKFAGVLRDRRWLQVVEDLYRWHHGTSGTCGTRSRSPAWAWSTRSRRPGSTAARGRSEKVEDHALGWYQALVEARDPVRDGPRPAPRRGPPGAAQDAHLCRTSPPCRTSNAGSSARSSSAAAGSWRPTRRRSTTSRGERRADFGLADLFGVSFRRRRRRADAERLPAARGRPPHRPRHPLLAGLDDAPRVIHGTWRLDVTPRGPTFAYRPLTLIPSYPDLPMEMVYPRVPKTDVAEVYLREVGRGPRRLLPLGHRPHLLGGPGRRPRPAARATPCAGRRRGAAGRGQGPRRARRDRLAAGGLDDRAPGQPDEPDDDEGPVPRADPGRRAAACASGCRTARGQRESRCSRPAARPG